MEFSFPAFSRGGVLFWRKGSGGIRDVERCLALGHRLGTAMGLFCRDVRAQPPSWVGDSTGSPVPECGIHSSALSPTLTASPSLTLPPRLSDYCQEKRGCWPVPFQGSLWSLRPFLPGQTAIPFLLLPYTVAKRNHASSAHKQDL